MPTPHKEAPPDNYYDLFCQMLVQMEIIRNQCKRQRSASVGQLNRMEWMAGTITIFRDVAYEETL